MEVQYGKEISAETLIVVESGSTALVGRKWMNTLQLDKNSLFGVHGVRVGMPDYSLLDKFPSIFQRNSG